MLRTLALLGTGPCLPVCAPAIRFKAVCYYTAPGKAPIRRPAVRAAGSSQLAAAGHGASPMRTPAEAAAAYGYRVSSCFDGGNIELLGAPDRHTLELAIRPDPYCEADQRAHYQWFSFRLTGVACVPLRLRLVNVNGASYGSAWEGYSACASYDDEDWFRIPTHYDAQEGVLTLSHTPACDAVHYAYFAPYPLQRLQQLAARLQAWHGPAALGPGSGSALVRLVALGSTLDGRDLDMLQVSARPAQPETGGPSSCSRDAAASSSAPRVPPRGPGPRIWVTARQHPGETMASWFAEGLLERLTDPHDPVARSLLVNKGATFHVVPNMCPDGSFRGHLRTNAVGTNLNRAWAAPSAAASPEVLHTLAAMDATGVDFFLDVHGDEELPHVFVAGCDGIPRWQGPDGPHLAALQAAFCAAYARHAPEFQTAKGYPPAAVASANLTVASKQVGERFGCLSLTLEMPFKDSADLPDPRVGWSPGRAKRLGAALLGALHDLADQLAPTQPKQQQQQQA